ncbi:response regulator [bacterium]|nr:response regulator [bacterium]
MIDKILCVDDEPNILLAYRRQLKKKIKNVDTALGGEEGLNALDSKGPYAVVISDLRMPGMSGIQFLARVRKKSPDTVRIMITGFGDLESAMSAVNDGNVFRFLTKPVDTDLFVRALKDSLEQYRLITAERELLEKTLNGSVKVMTEVLSLVNPIAFSRTTRLKRYAAHIAKRLGVTEKWKVEMAAMLSHIGCITLHPDILEKVYAGQDLKEEERKAFSSHPKIGSKLLENIPRLEDIAEIIGNQLNPPQVGGESISPDIDFVSLGSQILNVVIDFDKFLVHGNSKETALRRLKKNQEHYNTGIVEMLEDIEVDSVEMNRRSLEVENMNMGMILDEDVKTIRGLLLVAKGQEITFSVLERLKGFSLRKEVKEPIMVLVQHADNADQPVRV